MVTENLQYYKKDLFSYYSKKYSNLFHKSKSNNIFRLTTLIFIVDFMKQNKVMGDVFLIIRKKNNYKPKDKQFEITF